MSEQHETEIISEEMPFHGESVMTHSVKCICGRVFKREYSKVIAQIQADLHEWDPDHKKSSVETENKANQLLRIYSGESF